jgi:GntR family transcriptional regulator/MocR family aminotransferase
MTTFSRMPVELPVAADRDGSLPLTEQISTQLRAALAGGRLAAGERLPSSRALATALGVSRTVVTTVYTQLFAEGWLEGRHGSGTYVAEGAPGSPAAAQSAPPGTRPLTVQPLTLQPLTLQPLTLQPVTPEPVTPEPVTPEPVTPGPASPNGAVSGPPRVNLRPGIPWRAGIDPAAWRRAWRHAGAQPVSEWPDPYGLPGLRRAVTGYLRRGRGLRCAAGQVLITRGVSAALGLIALGLLRPGDRVGVEEPGYRAARLVFAAHGVDLVPCRVDQAGLVVDELPTDLRLVYTTPAHQYPLGGRLPVPRRQALVAWARATGALILEDDYDGEFRYDVAPLPTLFGLDPEVVIYLGTTSKALTPTLGAGWLVARPDLAGLLAETGAALSMRVPEPAQHAVTELLASGYLERHVRRMRHEYARRRAAMTEILGPALARPGTGALPARLTGDTAGMHMILELPGGVADEVAAAARAAGVDVVTLASYFTGPPSAHGLVLGYGAADLAMVRRGCEVIAGIVAGVAGQPVTGRPRGRVR